MTGHYTQWWKDFALVKDLGIREFRYPIPWDKIEPKRGRRDWALMDGILHYIYDELGLSIIADTLHHTLPTRFVGGYLDPRMMDEYPDFVAEFAQRYPFVKKYVPFNEPTATLDFCGYRGWWQPHLTGDKWYVVMLRHAARAAAEAAHPRAPDHARRARSSTSIPPSTTPPWMTPPKPAPTSSTSAASSSTSFFSAK